MILEGVKLMVLGMTTVMLFLCLMILFINIVSFLTRNSTARELQAIADERALKSLHKRNGKEAAPESGDEDIAVIAAAVAAYESERFVQT
ncbi:MAG: OadG family protein [Desulfobacterium sp.]|jgi:sodium pump decarboxylase gamma subunit|nr:OadG family protein [Desulfobacterium sp.]